ncbi:MAG: radical SAM protein [Oscillospiraceae bacterium]|jgi:pyruvate-formate lyase-activating enzyme|nr:radical SAM protein [Oscillospiraceae bacterium]
MAFAEIKRAEFIVTRACTGRCGHCSEAAVSGYGGGIDAKAASRAVRSSAGRYAVKSVMTFGGEPLLYPDAVCEIHEAARACGVEARQLITNGFFSRDAAEIERTAARLCAAGVK